MQTIEAEDRLRGETSGLARHNIHLDHRRHQARNRLQSHWETHAGTNTAQAT